MRALLAVAILGGLLLAAEPAQRADPEWDQQQPPSPAQTSDAAPVAMGPDPAAAPADPAAESAPEEPAAECRHRGPHDLPGMGDCP